MSIPGIPVWALPDAPPPPLPPSGWTDPPLIQGQPDGSLVVFPMSYVPSWGQGYPGGAGVWDDAQQINQALLQAYTVRLAPVDFNILSDVNPGNGNVIQGTRGSSQSGDGVTAGRGSRLVIGSAFKSKYALLPNGQSSIACINIVQPNAGQGSGGSDSANFINGVRLRDFWIDGTNAPNPNTTVAAGSNGGQIALIASWSSPSPGVLAVASTAGFATGGGIINVITPLGTAVIQYTGISGSTFTGCTYIYGYNYADTISTGAAVASGVDGVACFGNIRDFDVWRVGCNALTGRGFAMYDDLSYGSVNTPDGQSLHTCMVQGSNSSLPGRDGFYGDYADGMIIRCHGQNLGPGSDAFVFNEGADNTLLGCRWDISRYGITCDAQSESGGFYDSIKIVGGGSQGNYVSGINVINSSQTGLNARAPVLICADTLDQDGAALGSISASLIVTGRNEVTLSGVEMKTGSHFSAGSPANSIYVAAQGTAPGHPTIQGSPLVLNPITSVFNSGAQAAANILQISGIAAIGLFPSDNQYAPYAVTAGGNVLTAFTGANSWAQTSGGTEWAWQLLPNGELEILGRVTVPTGFANNQPMASALAAGLQPNHTQGFLAFDITSNAVVRLFMATTGILTFGETVSGTVSAGDTLELVTARINLIA
jgi:hypothetical protein